ncbi:MAG: hypothetical protein COT81_03680 [Candidatus Buchananbacteria bacterium CG10_big_fil_rev_8_21_14_0_10_42_9]|uniref:Uncharacterized protein n=1 Tax=Candidatus Buchananbacteria bacterium CG10_big_fil_rev_8_21_14_0_10_42_9 TaxID=1974526 RepID=A0A2H0W0S6_9BACT|nr:MAG: hypothetical protein COT81_03680 [Candidatus Buchananbacteria bacterium CG10_big_fil_rev_8_21_14_0_10_42_9]
MEISRRNKIIIAILVVIVILVIAIIFLTRSDDGPAVNTNQSEQSQTFQRLTPNNDFGVELGSGAVVQPEQVETGSALLAVARTFAERYGSYSNQSDFENLKDVQALMTEDFVRQTQALINQSALGQNTEVYQGVTTKVVSAKIISLSDANAQVMASVQRKDARESTVNYQLKYQNLLLDMVKIGDGWLVNQATWQ